MREIKFRFIWKHDTTKEIRVFEYTLNQIRCGEVINPDFTIRWDLIETLQFTGLQDRHGKDIYEGDVVCAGDVKGEVLYHNKRAMFIIHDADNFNEPLYQFVVEIIGNIYETPELLT